MLLQRLSLPLVLASSLIVASSPARAEGPDEEEPIPRLLVRPFASVSYTSGADVVGGDDPGDGAGFNVGARFLLSANATQRFGVEVSYLDLYGLQDTDVDVQYTSVGIVIEQVLWDWFVMSIATLGYIGVGDNDRNPFGLRTNLGWQADESWPVRPFVLFRSDFIFDRETITTQSLSGGVRLAF